MKIKSLAEEAKIIRKDEQRAKQLSHRPKATEAQKGRSVWIFETLQEHRRGLVRREARASQLAYAFLRGVSYRKIEEKVHPGQEPVANRIADIVASFRVTRRWSTRASDQDKKDAFVEIEKWLAVEPMAQALPA